MSQNQIELERWYSLSEARAYFPGRRGTVTRMTMVRWLKAGMFGRYRVRRVGGLHFYFVEGAMLQRLVNQTREGVPAVAQAAADPILARGRLRI